MQSKYRIHFFAQVFACTMTFFHQKGMAQNRSDRERIQRIDSFIEEVKGLFPEVPGISVAIVKEKKKWLTKGYGYAQAEDKIKCTDRTTFYIASCTKSFTGLAAALLDIEKRVNLNDRLSVYYPSTFFAHDIHADSISLIQLITHTSGLMNSPLTFRLAYSGDSDFAKLEYSLSEETLLNRSVGEFEYGNVGYNIYTMAIYAKLGIDWRELLDEKIFEPTGMKHTHTRVSEVSSGPYFPASPYGFDRDGRTVPLALRKRDNTMQSAGGVMSNARDMARWLLLEMNSGRIKRKQIIPANAFAIQQHEYVNTKLQKPPFQGEGKYGLGLHKSSYLNKPVYYHFGGFPGFYTHFSFLPENKIGVVIMTNEGIISPDVANLIATYTYEVLLGEDSTDVIFEEKLKGLRTSITNKLKDYARSSKEKASRPWLLSKSPIAYNGSYHQEAMGTITVENSNNEIWIRIGNLSAAALPYTEEESIRVELIPGRGEVIRFQKNEGGEIVGLTYADYIFTKIN